MSGPDSFSIRELTADDVRLMQDMSTMFGVAFDEVETYTGARPGKAYLERLLGSENFIALAALKCGEVVGGLIAYVFTKFEQERSEIYIYDLAVAVEHRRQGIATALIEEVRKIAPQHQAWVVFIQADAGDTPAIKLYSKLGKRENAAHFDIDVKQ